MKNIFVTFQREGIHKFPGAAGLPGVEFLASPHRHMFHFKVILEVFHDDREVEFILFKRELEKLYDQGTLELDYMSCEMMADELAEHVMAHYPGRTLTIEVSEDGENGAICFYADEGPKDAKVYTLGGTDYFSSKAYARGPEEVN